MSKETNQTDAAEHSFCERTPSYSDIHNYTNGAIANSDSLELRPQSHDLEPPYSAFQNVNTQDVVDTQHQQSLNTISMHTTSAGLTAKLELESDTVEIYDRSNDGFQYSLKGNVELDWIGDAELLLKDARIDFMGYADTAVLRYEAGGPSLTTETPVHHTHDFIPTPMVLDPRPTPSSSEDNSMTPSNLIAKHHESLPIDLILPGHLPDSTDLEIGKIRYELQISLELVHAQGTSVSSTERFILRRPVLIHRIVYPSAHLQPRLAMGLDSGGVEIQVKVPRLLHCENTLLAVELYVKPRTRNVKLRKAKIVFEQIETDRYQRSSSIVAVPKAVVPLATHSSVTSPPLPHVHLPLPQSTGPSPTPRLLTRAIAQPLEVEFEELTTELQTQILNLQLVLSPELCVDVQSSWIQICHTLRVEVEYTTDEESYVMSPPTSVPPISLQELESREEQMFTHLEQDKVTDVISIFEQAPTIDNQEDAATIWDQEGDAIETGVEDQEQESVSEINGQPVFSTDKKALLEEEGTGPSTVHSRDFELDTMQTAVAETDSSILLPTQSKGLSRLSKCSSGSASSSYTYSLATEEIPVRVVRVVSTALVDASTLAQAAGETEAGLPTYESVIEATGLPAYAEEKIEDDHEEAEASGTVTGVLGGAARRLEGEDAEIERR